MNPVLVLIVHVLIIANLFISMTNWRRILVPYMYMPRFFKDLEIKLIYLSMKLNYPEIFVTFVVM